MNDDTKPMRRVHLDYALFYLKQSVALLTQNECYPADVRAVLGVLPDLQRYLEQLLKESEQAFIAERTAKGHFPNKTQLTT